MEQLTREERKKRLKNKQPDVVYLTKEQADKLEDGHLNQLVMIVEKRADGTVSMAPDFRFCPTLTDQHAAHTTDINYLMEKYQPDELATYMASRNQFRQEILGVDFSEEPQLQDAMNTRLKLQQAFEKLDPDIRNHFRNHVEFLRYLENPQNKEKLIKIGLLKEKQIQELLPPENANDLTNANKTPPLQPTKPNP